MIEPIIEIFEEDGYTWLRKGGGMKKVSLEDIYLFLTKGEGRGYFVHEEIRKALLDYAKREKLEEIIFD